MNKKFIIFIILILLIIAGGVFWWQSGEKTIEETKEKSGLFEKIKPPSSGGTTTIPSKTEFRVGEEIKVDNFSVIINSVKVVPKLAQETVGNMFMLIEPKEEYKFALVEFTVKNIGKEEDDLDISEIKLETTEGYKYEPSYLASLNIVENSEEIKKYYYCDYFPLSMVILLPRESKHGCEGFEIPKDLEPVKLLIYKGGVDEKPDIIINLK